MEFRWFHGCLGGPCVEDRIVFDRGRLCKTQREQGRRMTVLLSKSRMLVRLSEKIRSSCTSSSYVFSDVFSGADSRMVYGVFSATGEWEWNYTRLWRRGIIVFRLDRHDVFSVRVPSLLVALSFPTVSLPFSLARVLSLGGYSKYVGCLPSIKCNTSI